MKQITNHQPKEKNQIMGSNGKSITGAPETTILLKPTTSRSNIFMVQNIGKDPPGRWRSPGMAYCMGPDNQPVSFKSNKIIFNVDFQIFKQIQNPNFINN